MSQYPNKILHILTTVRYLRLSSKESHLNFAYIFVYFVPTGESLFTLFASLTYAYHYLMTLKRIKTLNIERA